MAIPPLPDAERPRRSEPSPPPAASEEVRTPAPSVALAHPARRFHRYVFLRIVLRAVVWMYSRARVEGLENLPTGPAVLCFSHLNWADPFFLVAAMPKRPRLYFFGPEQEDMSHGFRNRLMSWSGFAIPYKPGNRALVAAARRVDAAVRSGGSLAIAGEGRIHAGESALLPFLDGPAYFALRLRIPIVPVAINGTSWLGFRRDVRVRIGTPIQPPASASGRQSREAVEAMTAAAWAAVQALVADFPDRPRPRWIGGPLTELFNDWPEGSRPPVPERRNTP